ncbi:GntR family transcriptional regulator [Curtobacterium flaccumfaciens pv. betae]|nr:GntR family transcriptional regulator [Curtobacterium sp. VKM Ac-2852]MBO9038798.1 GntR family transcriptional regulator [Curtobacterium flaccumfaciens pv. flaccumfaciens]MBT1607713.1 GntR family transcriptional regulator [Curtobacterium flaccumfaciens pv. betae]TSD10991.1 GntR family transcriptional regulator [Curtobacterium sp. KBS0715]MBT1657802.1 GntR family transcriptional regulator [Curtobacterium flaccumfaciens pv. betae]MBT1669834.1 GntR family transcriptional regulator [Curtobacter
MSAVTDTTDAAPVSQTAQLYDNLRAAILTLDIAPGERISERGLEARFHASRTPVRAALSRLEREGLILHEGRSWTVTPIDLDEIASLAELRGILEPAAVRLAVQRATPEQLAEVRGHLDALRPTPDQQAGIRMGSTFHLDLAALGGNRFVTDAIADALTRLERTRWIEVRTPEARDAAWDEHSAIIDAVRDGDADRAAELVAAHVAGTNDRLLSWIAQERRRLRGAGMTIVGATEG